MLPLYDKCIDIIRQNTKEHNVGWTEPFNACVYDIAVDQIQKHTGYTKEQVDKLIDELFDLGKIYEPILGYIVVV